MRSLLPFLLALLCVSACWFRGGRPPRTNDPAPLEGTFVSGADTLFFGGEGRGIHWHFAEAPEPLNARGQGICVFLFHNEEYRHDAAETFRLRDTQGRELSFLLSNGPAKADELTLFGGSWPEGKTFRKTTAL